MSEMFLAEAAVAVVPDLTAFRVKLIRDLEVATSGVVANVKVAASGATTAAAAATTAGRGARQAAAGGTSAIVRAEAAREEVLRRSAAAVRTLADAERRAALTTNAETEAKLRLGAATREVDIRERAYIASKRTGSLATQNAAKASFELAKSRRLEAVSAFETARAERALAGERAKGAAAASAQRSFVARGAAAQLLGLAGLRGAVLSANAAFLAGTVAALGFVGALRSAANLESTLNVFAVTAGASADEMERVGEEAKALGADITLPGVSAGDAAETFLELSKAGLTVEESLEGARGTLQLATAAAISNSEATLIAASALNAFGLAGDQTVRVADVLTNAANLSQGSIADVGLSMQQAAAVARQVGVSFEDTIALLTLLAQNGIKGSDAGTSLRVAFTKLINPTDKARGVLESLNIQVRDLNGNVRPEVFADFAAAQANLTREQQDRNAGIVFGTDALRAYAIASREGLSGLDAVREGLEKQGSAQEIASARTVGLAGSWENLKNQASTLGIAIGNDLKGPTQDFVDILAGGIGNITSFVEWLGKSEDQSKVTGEAYHNLAIRAAEIRAAQGDEAALEFLRHLESGANQASLSFTNLVIEAGTINRAVNARDGVKQLDDFTQATEHTGRAGEGLRTHQQELNAALEATQPAALKARDGIEAYRAAIELAGRAAEGLQNRIDESADRFASTPQPAAAQPRPEIGPEAKNAAAQQIANAKGDLAEVERLQEQELARLKRLRLRTIGNIEQRTEIFNKIGAAEAALISTRKQIEDKAESDAKQADDDRKDRARKAQSRREKADRAVVDAITDRSAAFDTRKIVVEATPELGDDITLAENRKKFLTRQIEIAKKSIKDDELKSDTLRDLRGQRKRLTTEIEGLLVEQSEAAVIRVREGFDAQVNLAQALGNIPLQIKLIDQRIAALGKLTGAKEKEAAALFVLKNAQGLVEKGNLDLMNRPNVKNAAGGTSSVFSGTFGIDGGKTVVLPRVVGGKVVSKEEAFAHFKKTGQHLGIFNTLKAAERYSELLHQQQADLKKTGKLVGKARTDALLELANLTTQREGLEDQRIQEGIGLGQSILDLTGNKNVLLKALSRAVAETQKDIVAAKAAGRSTVVLQTELNNFLAQRKEVLEGAKKASEEAKEQGTTAFELLTLNAETFNATGGNLVNGNQPFAGPTGFTADIAQFLTRQRGGVAGATARSGPAPSDALSRNDAAHFQSLTDEIRLLRDAILGGRGDRGRSSTVPGGGSRHTSDAAYYDAVQARKVKEGRVGGR